MPREPDVGHMPLGELERSRRELAARASTVLPVSCCARAATALTTRSGLMLTWLTTPTTNPTTSPEAGRTITVDTEPGPLGAWLRCERERRRWTRPEMARRLIKAAEGNDDHTMPDIDRILSNLYRWERGTVTPGDRYRLYFCHAFGITSDCLGAPRNDEDVTYFEFQGPVTVSITIRDDGAQVSVTSHPGPAAG